MTNETEQILKDNETELYSDIETELKPLLDYCKFIYIENELSVISLKDDVKTKDICILFDCKQKDLIKLFDWFNNNLEMVEIVKEDLLK